MTALLRKLDSEMEAAHSQHLVGQDEDRIDWRAGLGQGLDKRGAFVIVPAVSCSGRPPQGGLFRDRVRGRRSACQALLMVFSQLPEPDDQLVWLKIQ